MRFGLSRHRSPREYKLHKVRHIIQVHEKMAGAFVTGDGIEGCGKGPEMVCLRPFSVIHSTMFIEQRERNEIFSLPFASNPHAEDLLPV